MKGIAVAATGLLIASFVCPPGGNFCAMGASGGVAGHHSKALLSFRLVDVVSVDGLRFFSVLDR
jgi:hypothetical protein